MGIKNIFDEDEFFALGDNKSAEEEEKSEEVKESVDKQEESAKETQKETVTDYQQMEKDDLAQLKNAFPTLNINSLTELENAPRYGELRDKGLTAQEAFLATNGKMLEADAEAVGKAKAESKAHLMSVAKKKGTGNSPMMTNEQLSSAREFFANQNMTDEDLLKLYDKVASK